ncbi:cytochrome c biogenesis CcdA family protein [Sphingobium sp. HBC34]|uniref:Cytochrome c biogenesis CcdA family protein n=1 Tax=Sphingobium cyanobacteriorum TaxID=3063954 RepID=A0ABT8ZRN2_9SPHN|nr:cytochrome c biogenesis CcdA family protein [Sphingobium sp. HBC34]MDO7837210.1 cytochrome c biogenesis CcdA family protein [Sphingobium sp. HBC34]
MTGEILLAFLAGVVTILNPCVLPLIPILVSSALGRSRLGPLALAAGLASSFATFGFLIVAFGFQLGIDEQAIRIAAGILLILAGVLLLVPAGQAAISAAASPLTNRANQILSRIDGNGAGGQFLVGLVLGLVWAPCVGPTLGAAIAAASQGADLVAAFLTFLAFGIGVALSIVLFAYGSRRAFGTRAKALQSFARYAKPAFGASLLIVGLLVVTGLDRELESMALAFMPDWLIALTTRY